MKRSNFVCAKPGLAKVYTYSPIEMMQAFMHKRFFIRLLKKWHILLLVSAMLCSPSMVQALSCDATPGGEGNASESGTPGPLLYFQPTASVSGGSTSISVSSTAGLAAGDLVLVIQMQSAAIDSTNTNAYGDGSGGDPASGWLNDANFTAGYYEYAAVGSVGGGTITLTSGLVHSYYQINATGTIGQRRFQVIRVPQYDNLTLTGNLTAPAWNGYTGGVLALDVAGDMAFNGYTVDMSGRGFRGGGGRILTGGGGGSSTDYRSNATNNYHGSKGEGIAGTPRYVYSSIGGLVNNGIEGYPNGSNAMGAPANAGGGGTDGHPSANDENSGGGGGGNGGAGGRGGNSWSSDLPIGGFGGADFASWAAPNRIIMGGGGGAASANNAYTLPPHGGAGGGLVLIRAGSITGSGTINVNGADGTSPIVTYDGGGGGGAGGSVILLANTQTGSITINALGGSGGNADPGGAAHGPGGGGGGGVVFTNTALSPIINIAQGASGYSVTPGNYYGASPSGGNVGNGIPNTDPNAVDGVDSGAECVVHSDLSISKTRSSGAMTVGSSAQFKIVVSNNGPDDTVANIVVTDVLDSAFNYTGYIGTGWSCVESPAQTVTCTNAGPLVNGASLPDLFINVNISSSITAQSVSNTATVALGSGNTDSNLANNSSTLNDTIYGTISGNKLLYTYPTSGTGGTLQRVVPTTTLSQTIPEATIMDLDLNPVLAGDLTINNNIAVYLCLRREGSGGGGGRSDRSVSVTLRRADTNALISASAPSTGIFNSTNWNWYSFTINHTGPTTIPTGVALRLEVSNDSSGFGTRTVGISSNGGSDTCSTGISRAELDASTVINVDSVAVYDAASPAGNLITSMVEGATVYVRSTVSDPFGYADINNNTVLNIYDSSNVLISGPYNDTNIISASGNTKQFEYAVTVPTGWADSPHTFQVRANEGTEGTVYHLGSTTFTITGPPALSVSKLASQSSASPGNDVSYTIQVSNSSILGTGYAANVLVSDALPENVSFKLGSMVYTDGPVPYSPSTLSVGTIQYSNDGGATWTYVPVSGGGGAPVGYDSNVTNFRISFNGTMPSDTVFQIDYTVIID